jgi:hypothetical protein
MKFHKLANLFPMNFKIECDKTFKSEMLRRIGEM